MSALFESGFFTGAAPWHNLGNIVPEDTRFSVDEGIIAAGMNWDVYTRPAGYQLAGQLVVPMEEEIARNVYTMRRMLVDGVEQEQVLGLVGGTYKVVQNAEIFQWFQPYLTSGEAYLHTAGSLNNGRWVWALAKLNRKPIEVVPGDFVEKFLLLSSSHDGTQALRVGFTPIRVVCANTLAAATCDKRSQLLRLKHTKMIHATLESVHDIVNLMDADFEATAEQFRYLAATKVVNQTDLARYVVRVVTNDNPPEDGLSTRLENIVASILERVNSPANTLPGVGGSWWACYNAMTEHLTWAAGGDGGEKTTTTQKANNRLSSLWFGKNQGVNELALTLALEMAV